MKLRNLLLAMQALGALTLLAYPGVLVAGVMSFAAAGQATDPGAFLVLGVVGLSLIYPLIWIALWFLSWRAFRAGRTTAAFLYSTPPVLVFGAGVVLAFVGSAYTGMVMTSSLAIAQKEIEHVRGQSALGAVILEAGADRISIEDLKRAINGADVSQLSTPIERLPFEATLPPGMRVERPAGAPPDPVRRSSPLGLAIEASGLADSLDTKQAKAPLLEGARLLVARGARLCAEEETNQRLIWLAEVVGKGLALPDPQSEKENPLVWRIASAAFTTEQQIAQEIFSAANSDPALLHRPTRTYGTPLRAALVRGFHDRVGDLLYNGADLSPEEAGIRPLAAAVEEILSRPQSGYIREKRAELARRNSAKVPARP